jgi:hypothetical protein
MKTDLTKRQAQELNRIANFATRSEVDGRTIRVWKALEARGFVELKNHPIKDDRNRDTVRVEATILPAGLRYNDR